MYQRVSEKVNAEADPRVHMIREKSQEAGSLVPNELDFVYIDGLHTYEGCSKDIEVWWPKIRKGGMLMGDDFHMPGVAKAVEEFGYCTLRFRRTYTRWWWRIK